MNKTEKDIRKNELDKYYDELYEKQKERNAYEQSLLFYSTHITDGITF